MPRTFSPAMAEACLSERTDEVLVGCATIRGEGLETKRICTDTLPLDRAAGQFQPWPFEIVLPEDTKGAQGAPTMRVCNVDREVSREIREYGGVPEVEIDVVLASQPDTVEMGPFVNMVAKAGGDESVIELTLGSEEDPLNQQVPGGRYQPSNSQGLFV